MELNNIRLSEIMGRPDFAPIIEPALNRLLVDAATEEPSVYSELFTSFPLMSNNVKFPSFNGLTVGKITEGQEIPFVSLGVGAQFITAEDYGVRAGFTHEMVRDDQYDVIRYTTMELGRAHTRTKNRVAFKMLEAAAGHTEAAATPGTLTIDDIRKAKIYGATLKELGSNIPRPAIYTHIVMHPEQSNLLLPAKQDETPPGIVFNMQTGELTGVAGLRVLVTSWLSPGVVLLVNANNQLLYCEREALHMSMIERFATAAEEVRSLEAYTFAVLNSNNVYKITLA